MKITKNDMEYVNNEENILDLKDDGFQKFFLYSIRHDRVNKESGKVDYFDEYQLLNSLLEGEELETCKKGLKEFCDQHKELSISYSYIGPVYCSKAFVKEHSFNVMSDGFINTVAAMIKKVEEEEKNGKEN